MIQPAKDLVSEFIGNFRQVDENVFAGAQPQIPEGLAELIVYGVEWDLDLQGHSAKEEQAACGSFIGPFHFLGHPLPGLEIITEPAHEEIDAIVSILCDAAKKGKVFVHCLHGSDRTGCIIGCYRIVQGATVQEAIDEMRKYHNSWIEFGYRGAVEDFYEERVKRLAK